MSRTIEDLREHLFATLAALRDEDNPMDIDRARAVAEVSQQVINSAKVEVEHLRVTGRGRSAFLQIEPPAAAPEPAPDPANGARIERRPGDAPGITGITRHKLLG